MNTTKAALVAAGLLGFSATVGRSQDLSTCRAIPDDAKRLACFDKFVIPGAPQRSGEYQKLSLTDFKLDQAQLKGHRVAVDGSLWSFGGMVLLKSGLADFSPVMVKMDAVPRDQRKQLIEQCQQGCEVTVLGTVGDTGFATGIIAQQLQFK
jgi:hypothetical protein